MQAKRERVSYVEASTRVLHVRQTTFDAPWHFHPEYELTYIVCGQGLRFTGDRVEPFGPGDFVLLGPGIPHHWICQDNEESRGGPAEAVVCQFLDNFLGEEFWQRTEFARVRRLLDRTQLGLVVGGEATAQLAESFCELPQLNPTRRLLRLLEILIALAETPDELRTLVSATYKATNKTADAERLDRVFRLVNKHYTQQLTLNQAAQAAALSPSAFCRFFREQTGKTFTEFVNEVRIGRACHTLLESDQQIAMIALDCGFPNLSNFNRRFRAIVGVTPRQYRKKGRLRA